MDHPDFRVGGKIFATLGYPDAQHGTIMLSPLDQDLLLQRHAKAFNPAAGVWGKTGATSVTLRSAPKRVVALALESAWTRRATKALLAERTSRSTARKRR